MRLFGGAAGRVRTPTVFQMEATECGAASLGMVLSYHGCHKPLEELRVACGVSRDGSVASRILRAARSFHMRAEERNIPAERLGELPLPSILFWDFNHYVVFEGRAGRYFYVNNPSLGPQRYTEEEFARHYTGVALTFEPEQGFEKGGRRPGVFGTLVPLLYRVKSVAALIFWVGLLLVLPGLLLPAMLRIFIDEVLAGKGDWLYPLLMAFGATACVQALLVWLERAAMRRGELSLAADGTVRMLEHMFTLPMEFFSQRKSSVLQYQVSLHSTIAEAVFGLLAGNAVNCLVSVFFLVLMCTYSVFLSGIALLTALLNFVLLRFVNEKRQVLNQALMVSKTRLHAHTTTGIAMMESIRAGGREEFFFNEWSSTLSLFADKRQAMQQSSALFGAAPSVLAGANSVLILCFGAWRIIEGDMTLGGMMAFMALMGAFMAPVNSLVKAGAQLQELKGSVERIEDVMSHPSERRFAEAGQSLDGGLEDTAGPPEPVTLSFEQVSFGYNRLDEPLIRDFSLTVRPGQWVALVGPSGSGKSTAARLAAGLYAPWTGSVKLNGEAMERYTRQWCNRRIAVVDQHILLFSGTVAENLTLYERSADPKRLHKALTDAHMAEDLALRGDSAGLDSRVGELGNNFSGGQRQRLEIARALAKNTPLLILDEATSALDPSTEAQIYDMLRKRGCACLIIAHRLSAIRSCDEIIVLEKGLITERGDHQSLMAQNGVYAALMRAQ